ncbi:EAL domain-containing protein [Reinekea blandensis]|uniref:Disrupted signaling protein (XGGDEF and EAL domains) n=1 Tax=Reinekea blandensis MED297 TaxID=314283 RepID=A4BCQ3_9GAMM|nr:EAL domain-containing protein [Reinekea blandensis]EAR09985.1 disrupted signaling protein (xGGDEF and EAL domains) [Reinekea sp. MED297] [Reinekea blandensis MED297]
MSVKSGSSTSSVTPAWREQAMKTILLHGLLLCLLVGALALLWHFLFQAPLFHALMAFAFAGTVLVARRVLMRNVQISVVLFLLLMYLGALAIKLLASPVHLSNLGVIFLYSIPLMAMALHSLALSRWLMYFNLIPFGAIIFGELIAMLDTRNYSNVNFLYLHLTVFVFFNFIVPFAMRGMILDAWRMPEVRQSMNKDRSSRKRLYRMLFEHSTQPYLIVRHAEQRVIDMNEALRRLLPANALSQLQATILNAPVPITRAQRLEFDGRTFIIRGQAIEQSQNHLYVVEDVSHVQRLQRDVDEMNDRFNRQMFLDPHSGLPNRQAFVQAMERLKNTDAPIYLVCVKQEMSEYIAERLGPTEHARKQKTFARDLKARLNAQHVGKLSQHHFGLLVTGLSEAELRQKLTDLYLHLSHAKYDNVENVSLLSKFVFAPIDGQISSMSYLLDQTEKSLVLIQSGEFVVAFRPDTEESRIEQMNIRSQLELAVDRDELSFVLQPKVNAQGELIEFEALMRWEHRDGHVSPASFIPMAEEFGLVTQLTDWLLDAVAEFQSQPLRPGQSIVPVSVNVSARDLERGDLVERVLKALSRHGVQPDCLGIELTETALLGDWDGAMEQLHQLRFWGIRVSVDDFGIGHSSLSRMVDLPVDCLKLDRSFMQGVTSDRRRLMLVRAMVDLCRSLNMQVVAEGVETEAEVTRLSEFDGLLFQGFYFSQPLSRIACRRLLGSAASSSLRFPLDG